MPDSAASRFSRFRRRITLFHLTLAVSLMLHLLILFSPAWSVPGREEPIRIEATLKLPPARAVGVAASAKPHARSKAPARAGGGKAVLARPAAPGAGEGVALAAKPAEESGAGALAEKDAPEVSASEPAAEEEEEAKPAAPVLAWPREGRIRYQLRYGDVIAVGELVTSWSHDGEHYTMRAEGNTSGLARLFKRFTANQQSQGKVGPEGLTPTGFQEDLNGRQSHAVFDWQAGKVISSRPDRVREYLIVGAAQDILSLAFHLAFLPESTEKVDLLVVAGRWGVEAELSQVANEVLSVPWGKMLTRHFHCEAKGGDYGIDIWLDRDHLNAPIRIRVDDRKQGHVIDQIARELELDGTKIQFNLNAPQNRGPNDKG
ncbi:DUF3108 domain-containing protein [Niveibacterium terrae]|uniref:DUF3108 domain-containing protein n=1 Tax=Niveibacterium terrae TaxID=3373598 RepID=UPI003A90C60A